MARPTVSLMLIAGCLGVLYAWIAIIFWRFYAVNSPMNGWLIDVFAVNGYRTLYRVAIGIHDVVVNIVVAAPFAALLMVRSSLNNWICAAVAGMTAVVFANWGTNWSVPLLTNVGFLFGLAMTLLSLPIAFAGIRAIRLPPQTRSSKPLDGLG